MKYRNSYLVSAFSLLLCASALAQDDTQSPGKPGLSTKEKLDKVWGYTRLYESEDNPVFRKISFTGRFQYDLTKVDGDFDSGDPGAADSTGVDFTDGLVRRMRLGFKLELFKSTCETR